MSIDRLDKPQIILLIIHISASTYLAYTDQFGSTIREATAWYATQIFVGFYCIWVLGFLTDGVRQSHKDYGKPLGIWGYLWRYYLAVFFTVAAVLGINLKISLLKNFILVTPIALVAFTLFVFFFYCGNKLEKLRAMKSVITGI